MPITKVPVGENSWSAGPLLSGPVLGEVGETDAFVWAQARDSSALTLTLYRPDKTTTPFSVLPEVVGAGLCVVFHVTGLAAGTSYEYDVSSVNGTTPHYHLRPALPMSARRAKIAIGSCFHEYQKSLPIFDSIVREKPDVVIMMGDNSYYAASDLVSEDAMMLAHLRHRNNASLRGLVPNSSVIAIWDDHDYGANDADEGWFLKADALDAFQRMWAERTYGLPGVDGVFSTVRCGPAEIFLTDGRYYRLEKNHILGPDQLAWLKGKLLQSTAPVKLIVSGTVVIPQFVKTMESGSWEGWERDGAAELKDLLDFIQTQGVKGVLFASGDLHLGYLMFRPGSAQFDGRTGPDYWELVSSPLAQSPWHVHVQAGTNTPTYDPYLVQEIVSENFGILDIDLDRGPEEIQLSLKDPAGVSCVEQRVPLGSLQSRTPKRSGVVWNNGKCYFFAGNRYARYTMDPAHEGVDPGYPLPIDSISNGTDVWHGLARVFPDGIDAGVAWPNGKAYFFRGNSYVRYTMDPNHEGVDSGYPKYIVPTSVSKGWKGIWPSGADAVVVWNNGKAYFFKGREYIRYDINADCADADYPKPINAKSGTKDVWPGLAQAFPDGIDTAVVWPNGKAYFFKGNAYVRYTMDPAVEGVDPGYPRPILGNWPRLENL